MRSGGYARASGGPSFGLHIVALEAVDILHFIAGRRLCQRVASALVGFLPGPTGHDGPLVLSRDLDAGDLQDYRRGIASRIHDSLVRVAHREIFSTDEREFEVCEAAGEVHARAVEMGALHNGIDL